MPGAGRSESAAVRTIGATVVLIAVVGYLFFGWSFDDSAGATPTVIGGIVSVSAIGWTLYRRVRSARGR